MTVVEGTYPREVALLYREVAMEFWSSGRLSSEKDFSSSVFDLDEERPNS